MTDGIPKTMLLAYGAPDAPHAGTVLLDALCRHVPRDDLVRFAVHKHPERAGDRWLGFPLGGARRPAEAAGGHALRPLRPLTSAVVHHLVEHRHAPRLAGEAAAFGRAHGVALLWVVLNRPTIIHMAHHVARALGVPMVVTVCDPPASWSADQGLGARATRRMEDAFAACLREAARVTTASEGMRQDYRERYGVDSGVLIHAVPAAQVRDPGAAPAPGAPVRIAFAGSLYARREWDALLDALDGAGWQLGTRPVQLRVIGRPVEVAPSRRAHVEQMGWLSVEETIGHVADADVAYLPYWFDEARRTSVRLCFPNKMTTYLAAGRPVFYHGPEDASAAAFLRRYPAGVACHTLEPDAILASLVSLFDADGAYDAAVRAGRRALEEELGEHVLVERFAHLLGVPAAALAGDAVSA